MAQNINIPFDLTINSIKNTNEAFSRLSNQIASNVSDGIEKGLGKINLKGFDVTQLSKDIKGSNSDFKELVDTVTRLKKVFGAANPVVSSFTEALPAGAQNASKAMLNLERVARGVLSRLASGNEEQVKQAQATLKAIFSSDIFNSPANKIAKAQFISNLNQGLKDLEDTAKKTNKAITDDEIRNNKLREKAISDAYNKYASEEARNRELNLQATLSAAKARQAAEIKIAEETKRKQEKLEAEQRKIIDDTANRIVAEKQAKKRDDFIGPIEERGRREEMIRKINIAAEKQLEKETRKVAAAQERINDLLAKAKSLNVQIDPKFAKFVNANPTDIAAGQIKDKNVKVTNDQLIRDAKQLNKELGKIKTQSLDAGLSVESFGSAAALAFKRYGAFLVGTFAITRIVSIFGQATDAAIQFEAQMTKVEQVTTSTNKQLLNISKSIRDAAIETGTSIVDIADAVQTFAQAGFTDPKQLAKVANDLAKIPLAATFGDIKSTSEGLIAIFGQFNKTLDDTGRILNLVNQFSADYAVESKDLFEGVKRGGAVFAAAGGSLEEFVSLFSLLRSSTRQSAETIGTFFKSGITQLLNPNSQLFLKQLGVNAEEATGQVSQLATVLFGPNSKFTKNQIINIGQQLTGDRQIGSFLALLREVEQQQAKLRGTGNNDILTTLSKVSGSLDRSVSKRVDDVGVSFQRLKQSFTDFAIELLQDNSIKQLIKDLADITIGITKLISKTSSLAPALITLVAASGLPKFATGFSKRLGGGTGSDLTGEVSRTNNAAGSFLTKPALIGAGLVLGGSILQSDTFKDKKIGGGLTGSNAGTILNFAGLGVILGQYFGPLGLALGGLTGAIVGLTKSLIDRNEKTRKETLEASKTNLGKLQGGLSDQFSDVSNTQISGAFVNFDNAIINKNRSIFDIGLSIRNEFINELESQLNEFAAQFSDETQVDLDLLRNTSEVERPILEIIKPILEGLENFKKGLTREGKSASGIDLQAINLVNEQLSILNDQVTKRITDRFKNNNIKVSGNEGRFDKEAKDLYTDLLTPQFLKFGKRAKLIAAAVASQQNFKVPGGADSFEGSVNNFVDQLKNSLSSISLVFKDITKNFDSINSQLDSIVTNLGDTVKGNNIVDKQSLFKQLGFDNISNFIGGNASLSKSLNDFLNQGNNRANLIQEALPFSGGKDKLPAEEVGGRAGFALVARSLFKDDTIFNEFVKNFEGPLTTLAKLSDITFQDLFKKLAQSTNIDQFVESFQTPIKEVLDFLLETENKRIQVLNRRLEIEKALTDQARQGNESLFNLKNTIQGIRNTSATRGLEKDAFNNESGGSVAFLQARASLFASNANRTSFGSTTTFTQELLDAANKRNAAVGAASERNRKGLRPDEGVLTDSLRAQSVFADKQQELNQRLVELDSRVSAAASATDTLREAFNSLRENVRSAGQAITGLTQKDFGNIATTLKGFVAGGGTSNPFGPLSNFSQKQFGFLQQGLGLLGNIDLGGGQTGQKLLNKIFDSLGSTALGGLAGIFTGKDETQNVQKQLEKLRADAEKAAQVEESLRQEQIALLTAQAGLIPIEQKFYKDQLDLTRDIGAKLDPLISIKDSVSQLFKDKAQNVKLISDTSESKNTSNTPVRQDGTSQFPFVLPNNATPVIIPNKNIDFNPKPPLEPFRDTTRPSEFRVPRSLGPNVIEPRKTPQEVAPSGPLGPDGRPRNNNLPVPGFELPKVNIPKGTAPEIIFGAKEGVEINTGVGNLVDIANNIQKSLEKLSGTQKFTLDVAPLQVNVGLTAPDILALAGTQLQENIMKNIAVKLSEVFRTDPETSSKILSSFATA